MLGINEEYSDYVQNAPETKTIVHWWDLYGRHYLKLKPDFQKQLFENAIEKAGCFSSLERKLGINRRTIAECSKGKRSPRITDLIKVANFVRCRLEKVEKQITNIGKSFFAPKLPFCLRNSHGAEIRAAFLSDGHLPKEPTTSPTYCAYEKELHLSLIESCKSVFGNFTANIRQGHKSLQTRFPVAIGAALELAGVPRGDKRRVQHTVPKDILTGPEKVKCAYLRRVFDDEGDICLDKYGKRAIRITRSFAIPKTECYESIQQEKWLRLQIKTPKHRLLCGEQLLLKTLGIDARVYSEGVYLSRHNQLTAKWRIQIGQQDSLKIFAEKVKFSLPEKQNKLLQVLNSYRVRKRANGVGRADALKIAMNESNEQGFFKYGKIGQELLKQGFSYDLASLYVNKFLKEGIVEKISRGKYVFKNNMH